MLLRAHEWLADHVRWVQYPRVQRLRPAPFWRHQMPWTIRLLLGLFGALLLVACAIALFFLGVLFWALVAA